MKKNWLTTKEEEYFRDNEEIIELEQCQIEGKFCNDTLLVINSSLLLVRKYKEAKEYSKAISELNKAFDTTLDLKQNDCTKCAEFFRDFIYKSLEKTYSEIVKMSKGFLKRGKYKHDLQLALDSLKVMKERIESPENPVGKLILNQNSK